MAKNLICLFFLIALHFDYRGPITRGNEYFITLQPILMYDQKINVNQQVRVTNREYEVLAYLCHGFTSKEIGRSLHISGLTVDKHKKNLLDKFAASSSAQLVYLAMQQGLLHDLHSPV